MYFSIPEVGSSSRVVSFTHSKTLRTLLQEQTGPYSNPPYAGQMAGKQEKTLDLSILRILIDVRDEIPFLIH